MENHAEGARNFIRSWQATTGSLSQRLRFLYFNENMSDVHFIVGQGEERIRIPAHKFILSIGSEVFDTMFNGYLSSNLDDIEILDIERQSFSALLNYLYTDEVDICPDSVIGTLYAARKYAVWSLEERCVEFLKRNLCADNAFTLLSQARLFDETQLTELCLSCIDKNTAEAISSDGFHEVDLDTVRLVLKRDSLGAREVQLFEAVMRWAEHECRRKEILPTPINRRKVLKDVIQLVRFPLMMLGEFTSSVVQSGVLSDNEIVGLFMYFTVNPKPPVKFSERPRRCLTGSEWSVIRFAGVKERWGYNGTCDRICFSVSRKLHVVGLGLYGSLGTATDYSVSIAIIRADTGHVMGQNDTGFSSDGTDAINRVMFKEPIEVLPGVSHIASATLRGPDSYYGTDGSRRVLKELSKDEKVEFIFSFVPGNNGTSEDHGQIPEILFYA